VLFLPGRQAGHSAGTTGLSVSLTWDNWGPVARRERVLKSSAEQCISPGLQFPRVLANFVFQCWCFVTPSLWSWFWFLFQFCWHMAVSNRQVWILSSTFSFCIGIFITRSGLQYIYCLMHTVCTTEGRQCCICWVIWSSCCQTTSIYSPILSDRVPADL